MQILIVGSGGREHALALAVKQSPLCTSLYVAAGQTPAWAGHCRNWCRLPPITSPKLVEFADAAGVDFVIVGPDAPLAMGLVDALDKKGILAFGPTKGRRSAGMVQSFHKAAVPRTEHSDRCLGKLYGGGRGKGVRAARQAAHRDQGRWPGAGQRRHHRPHTG